MIGTDTTNKIHLKCIYDLTTYFYKSEQRTESEGPFGVFELIFRSSGVNLTSSGLIKPIGFSSSPMTIFSAFGRDLCEKSLNASEL